MEMSVKEMIEMIFEFDDDVWCEVCPLHAECGPHELFYWCGVWEEAMGEDL